MKDKKKESNASWPGDWETVISDLEVIKDKQMKKIMLTTVKLAREHGNNPQDFPNVMGLIYDAKQIANWKRRATPPHPVPKTMVEQKKCRHLNHSLIWGKGDSEPLPMKGFGGDFTIKPRHKALVGRPTPRVKVKQVYAWCPECGALKIDGGWIKPKEETQ